MEVLILGAGYVGTTTALTFAELGHQVTCVDPDEERITSLNRGEPFFYEPGLPDMLVRHLTKGTIQFEIKATQAVQRASVIFICVGTPSKENGQADLTYVEQASKTIGQYMKGYKIIVSKSTVPVGTCARIEEWIRSAQTNQWEFEVVSNPEFLREGNALTDSLHPHRIVIGSNSPAASATIQQLYTPLNCPFVLTNPRTAELIKYASNSFLAAKISYMNELARLCDAWKINIKDVALGMGLDPRIGAEFLDAGLGYGGSCFPKDVRALLELADEDGITLSILKKVKQVNESQYLYFLSKIERELGSLKGRIIAVLGLSFKPQTSDIRESPSLPVIQHLFDKGVSVRVHDPISKLPSWLMQPAIRQCDTVEETVHGADAVVLCTAWPDYGKGTDWRQLKSTMQNTHIFDGRNMLSTEFMRSLGFSYHGIGYPH